jgi:NitT/TauT family transport system substrate-binding protein
MKRIATMIVLAALLATGCASSVARAKGSSAVLRLGIFPNLTHAPGLIAIADGTFTKDLAPTKLEVKAFNSGSEASTALLAGAIDATYIGPGPTVKLFIKSGHVAVVSGVAEGGASFIVRKGSGIASANDLAGKKIADPGIGNTQDVALRTWLHGHGLKAKDEGGSVTVVPLESNSQSLQLFQTNQIDGAWLPEPYVSLLTSKGLATVFVDERTLWPGGKFLTTNLLVSTVYMQAHPSVVRNLVRANVEAIQSIRQDPNRAMATANAQIVKLGGKELTPTVLSSAWQEMTFTWDPLASSLKKNAQDTFALGDLSKDPVNILSVYKLDDLNAALQSLGLPAVAAAS